MNSDVPKRSKSARLGGLLEHWLKWSVIWGTRGMFVSAIPLFGYIGVGWFLSLIKSPLTPSEFLAIPGDPIFVLAGTLVSLFVVQATGSLVLYRFLVGVDNSRSQFVILMSYIGLGFGAAALRFLLPHSLAFLSGLL